MTHDKTEALALWRYHLVAEALSPRLGARERGLVVRRIAGEEHTGPDGEPRIVSRNTLDRWIRAYRQHGLAGLHDRRRSDAGAVRRRPDLLEEAARLRIEQPARSAAHIGEMLFTRHGVRIAERTLREQLARRGLARKELLRDGRVFGRYEAASPDERWIGDVLVGPFVPWPKAPGSVRARLFLIVDDHSRLVIGGRWMGNETLRAGQEVLHAAILRHGLPLAFHVDNGAAYAGAELGRSCGVLGIRLIHSRPYSPQGRGKQERLNRFIRDAFLAEAEHAGIETFEQLDDRFTAWAERIANTRVHAETGVTPITRFLAGGPPRMPDPDLLREAFRWSVMRVVTRTASVSLVGNRYSVEPALVGRRVELRFDPEDLSRIEVWHERRSFGAAVPFVIGRHVHRQVPQAAPPPVTERSGVDYLGLVETAHDADTLGRLTYRELFTDEEERS